LIVEPGVDGKNPKGFASIRHATGREKEDT